MILSMLQMGKKCRRNKKSNVRTSKTSWFCKSTIFWTRCFEKRRTEIDYLTGFVSQVGKKNNISTPFCDKVTEVVNSLGVGFEPSDENLAEIEKLLD